MIDRRALAANLATGVASNVTRMVLQLLMLPLMARLLGPSEIGLYALALPLINFVLLLSDAGLGDSLAKERSDDGLVWSSAFWGLMVTGFVGAVTVYGASFLIANAAGQPRLPQVVLPLCLTLLMVAATIVPMARMVRGGNTVPAAAGDMIGNVVGAALAIGLALAGFGVWAMVAQFVTIYAVRAIVYNAAQPFVPKLCFSWRSLLAHTGMGSQILGGRLIELATSMFERSQVSRGLGPAALGGYANACQIGLFLSNTVGSPLWTNLYYVAISRPREEAVSLYVRTHRTFALLTFPAATLLAFALPTLVPLLFGPAWRPYVTAIVVMVLACPWGNLATLSSALLYSRDRGRIALYMQAGNAIFRAAGLLALWPLGITALVGVLAVSNIGYYLFTVVLLSPVIGNERRDLLLAIAGPLVASTLMAVAMRVALPSAPTLVELIFAGATGLCLYLALLLGIDQSRTGEDLRGLLAILGKRPASA